MDVTDDDAVHVFSYIEPLEYLHISRSSQETEKGEPLLNISMFILNQDCLMNRVTLTQKEATILRNVLENFITGK